MDKTTSIAAAKTKLTPSQYRRLARKAARADKVAKRRRRLTVIRNPALMKKRRKQLNYTLWR